MSLSLGSLESLFFKTQKYVTGVNKANGTKITTLLQTKPDSLKRLTPSELKYMPKYNCDVVQINNKNAFRSEDISLAETLMGFGELKGNCFEALDLRRLIKTGSINFKPIFHYYIHPKTKNLTTAIILPCSPATKGVRGGDNFSIQINGYLSKNRCQKLLSDMSENGVTNTESPQFRSKLLELINKNRTKLEKTDINLNQTVNGKKQILCQTNEIADYQSAFQNNNYQLTRLYNQDANGIKTTIIVPLKSASKTDNFTIQVNVYLSKEQCNEMFEHMRNHRLFDTENPKLLDGIVQILNNIIK